MALTRKLVRELGIDEENAERIIAAHTESTDALKSERDAVSASLRDTERALQAAKELADGEKAAFAAYRAESERRYETQEKKSAYRALLSRAGIAEKYLDRVLGMTRMDEIPFTDGAIPDAEERMEGIRREWEDFTVRSVTSGTVTAAPPEGKPVDYDAMNDADYYRAAYRPAEELRA